MIHDFSFAKEELIGYRKFCDAIGYKRASGAGSHPGGSASRNNLSVYEYIRSATFYRDNSKMSRSKKGYFCYEYLGQCSCLLRATASAW